MFLKPQILHLLLYNAFKLCDEKEINTRTIKVKEETVKLLCILSTVKTSRFYIPGETNMVERLRKDAFDRGLFAGLTHIYRVLEGNGNFPEMKKYIREKVLNLVELKDLQYHAAVVEAQIEAFKNNA